MGDRNKEKEKTMIHKEKDKKHKKASRRTLIDVGYKLKTTQTQKSELLLDEKTISDKIGSPTKKLCLYAFEVAKAAIVPTNNMETAEPALRQSLDSERLIAKRKTTANRLH